MQIFIHQMDEELTMHAALLNFQKKRKIIMYKGYGISRALYGKEMYKFHQKYDYL